MKKEILTEGCVEEVQTTVTRISGAQICQVKNNSSGINKEMPIVIQPVKESIKYYTKR